MRQNRKNIMSPAPKCFCCKRSLRIERDIDNQDILYFDKHYYHKQCFEQMNMIKKKCFHCKDDIHIHTTADELIYYDKHFYHTDCFKEWCNAVNTKKRKMAMLNYNSYIDEAKNMVADLLDKKHISSPNISQYQLDASKQIQKWFDGSDLCAFIKETYDVTDPQWTRLSQVIEGTYPNISCPIPADELLDMWKRKLSFLQKQNQNLISKQGSVSPDKLIRYDIAILVKKYDSYKRWKEEQKILAAENKKEIEKKQNIISQQIIVTKAMENNITNVSNDFSDLVDDIFD